MCVNIWEICVLIFGEYVHDIWGIFALIFEEYVWIFETVICRDVLEDIVDLSAVDYTKRHTTPSPEVALCQ